MVQRYNYLNQVSKLLKSKLMLWQYFLQNENKSKTLITRHPAFYGFNYQRIIRMMSG